MALDQERSSYFLDLLRNAEASGDIAALNNIRQQYLTESGTPEAYAPIASVGQQAFQQSKPSGWDIPLEAIKAPMRGMGETIAAIPGIDLGLGEAMQSWAQPDAPTFAGGLMYPGLANVLEHGLKKHFSKLNERHLVNGFG